MLLLQILADGFVTGCAVGVVAITFAYVYSTTGVFHVAHAGVYTFGAYVAWYLLQQGLPFLPAAAISILSCAAVGALIQKYVYETLARRHASPLVMLIAALGLLAVLQNIVAMAFSPNILQFDLPWRLEMAMVGTVFLSYPQIAVVVTSLLILAGLMWFSSSTLLGQRIRAVASNPSLAEVTRLRPNRVFVIVLAIASGLVAVPAILTGVDQAIQPYTSILVLLSAVIAVIAGGIGSLIGAFVLAIVISMVLNVSILYLPGRWSLAFTYTIFIAFILIKPTGLFRTRVQRAS
ncbi:branched-chain amino acid ABC transporter permease [Microbaculum marinum]|uniref:Branched-chain amino acid ABC transporter permease n=1 Tax=Microbaculum marinum TaxID=1764581 RepID=A0AAW9RRD9_9HYPH